MKVRQEIEPVDLLVHWSNQCLPVELMVCRLLILDFFSHDLYYGKYMYNKTCPRDHDALRGVGGWV